MLYLDFDIGFATKYFFDIVLLLNLFLLFSPGKQFFSQVCSHRGGGWPERRGAAGQLDAVFFFFSGPSKGPKKGPHKSP